MSQVTGISPGIDFREQIEEATRPVGVSNAIGIVGVAQKGPTELTLLTSIPQCKAIFGEPHANNSAIKGVMACLKHNNEVWFKRVVSANAKKGATWECVEIEVPDENAGTLQTGESNITVTLAQSPVVTRSVNIPLGGIPVTDDGNGGLVQGMSAVGTIDYGTGELTINLPQGVSAATPVIVSYAYYDSTTAKPWIYFTTREETALYNNWTVNLSWANVGTTDVPKYKIDYSLKNAAGVEMESYRCDEDEGDELFIGKIISLYSKYVDVEVTGAPADRTATTLTIASGNSGLDATVDDIIGTNNTGMKAFYDPEIVDIATLVVPTWSDKRVWEEGIAIGKYRKDIVFIPSLPIGLTVNKVIDLVRGMGEFTGTGMQFDETFVPLYWPNGLIKNTATGRYDAVDIAPYIAATYSFSDSTSNIWIAPAGVKRGVIQGLDGLEYKATKEERDMLYSTEVNINPVVNVRGIGITLMGVRTSKLYKITDSNTALRYINIRRLCNYARKVVLMESMNNLFDQNDYYTWNDWKMRIDPYFRTMKEGRGLYDYEIIMDETTVTQEDIDAGRMPGMIRIAAIKPNEYIIINFVVAKDGTVSFDENIEVA